MQPIYTLLLYFSLFIILLLFRKIAHREGIKSFLIKFNEKNYKLFIKGAFTGLFSIGVYVFLVMLFNKGDLIVNKLNIIQNIKLTLIFLIIFLAVSLFEESMFRGYILLKLKKMMPKFVAIGASSIIFGLLHINTYLNNSISFWLGIINVTLLGIILSIVVLKTNSLMWALGFHIFWNLTQQLLLCEDDFVLNLFHYKEDIWTGTDFVPESGLIITIILVLLLVNILFSKFNNKREGED